MAQQPEESPSKPVVGAFTRSAAPIYGMFFLWGLGTGAQQLGRPLFAAAFGVPVFLVTLIGTSNSAAWFVTAPLTGVLTDRFGRRPLVIVGNLIRGVACVLQFYSTSYMQFIILEFLGAIGVSMWSTGSAIVMADITERDNRGRANAIRGMASRLGSISGPLVGAVLTTFFGLRSLFMFNAITKIPIHILLAWLIKETRPQEAAQPRATQPSSTKEAAAPEKPKEELNLSIFFTPAVIVVAIATLIHSMEGFQGVMGILFPLHVQATAGMNDADVGTMMGLAATVTFLISFPNGIIVDRLGRKASIVPGMILLGISGFMLSAVTDFMSVIMMILVYGVGTGMSMGSTEVYAMDLAPVRGRGTFLGIWSLLRNVGGIIAPLTIGTVAQYYGLPLAFIIVGILLILSGLSVAVVGKEPGGSAPERQPQTAA